MPDDLKNGAWKLRLMDGSMETVEAAYWSIDVDTKWLEFKNPSHKCVFAIREDNVLSVSRS
jgi:hypothetical protein